jgi:hypothetical protein
MPLLPLRQQGATLSKQVKGSEWPPNIENITPWFQLVQLPYMHNFKPRHGACLFQTPPSGIYALMALFIPFSFHSFFPLLSYDSSVMHWTIICITIMMLKIHAEASNLDDLPFIYLLPASVTQRTQTEGMTEQIANHGLGK